ncbi:MAG: phosphatase PAP2 family protein [Deinococcota bacterium]|nr:phosphatase PAP2 family protein [Deinococcota bacterium]
MTDNADAVWSGTRSTGPGIFALDSLGDETVGAWKPWLLTSGDEVRPPPPPAPDSAQRAAEIAEVRDYQRDANPFMELFFWPEDPDGRPEPGSAPVMSSQVAFYYAPFNHLMWLSELEQKLFEYRLDSNPPRAARAYALASVAFYDATVAVWDGRFAYWVARPAEWDPAITSVLTTYPNPEYPSGHTGIATATSEVLAYLFPRDAHYFRSRAVELGESRIWAGIHFRSAVEAGAELGRKVAAKVVAWAEQDGSSAAMQGAAR